MIALIISPTWKEFHASSPNRNLLNSAPHQAFTKFVVTAAELEFPEVREKINQCDALVADYPNSYGTDFFTGGPRFLIWGDEHCHTKAEATETEYLHAKYDYVLVGAPFSVPRVPKYFYVNAEIKDKRLYFPPCVPDVRPEAMPWTARAQRALLAGDSCPFVYPYRHACGQLASSGSPIDSLPHFVKIHEEFFKLIGTYKYAITCNSFGWLNYTVAKYFEIPWMGAVLIATPPPMDEQVLLGLQHGTNALFTKDPFESLRIIDSGGGEEIACAGMELMLKYHTVTRRLDYLARLVDKARGGKVTLSDAVDVFTATKETHEQKVAR